MATPSVPWLAAADAAPLLFALDDSRAFAEQVGQRIGLAPSAHEVVTIDVHNLAAFQNAFRCRTEHLEANALFVEYFAAQRRERELVVVAPDAGGVKRMERLRQGLARALGKPVGAAWCEKHRSGGVVSGELLVGEVAGASPLISA